MRKGWLVLCAAAFALGACSSGSDDGSGSPGGGNGDGNGDGTGVEAVSAKFLGTRPVEGLEIKTRGTDRTQTTDADGEFEFVNGDIIEVFIDKLSLGTAPARRIVTVDDLSAAQSAQTTALTTKQSGDFSNRTVNVLRTLETLGRDNGTNLDVGEAILSDEQVAALQLDSEPDAYAQSYNDADVGGQPLLTEDRIVEDFITVVSEATDELLDLVLEDLYGTWSVLAEEPGGPGRVSGMAFRANRDLDVFGEIFDNPSEAGNLVEARWDIVTVDGAPALRISSGGDFDFPFVGFDGRSIVVEIPDGNGSFEERFTLTPINIPARLIAVGDWELVGAQRDPEPFSFAIDGSFVQGSSDDQVTGEWSVDALKYVAEYENGDVDDCFFSGLEGETDLRFTCALAGSSEQETEVFLTPQ